MFYEPLLVGGQLVFVLELFFLVFDVWTGEISIAEESWTAVFKKIIVVTTDEHVVTTGVFAHIATQFEVIAVVKVAEDVVILENTFLSRRHVVSAHVTVT